MPMQDPAPQRSDSKYLVPPSQNGYSQQRQKSPDVISTSSRSENDFSSNESAGDDDGATTDTEHSVDMERADIEANTKSLSLDVGDSTAPAPLGHASGKRCSRVPTAVNEFTTFFVHEKGLNRLFTIAFEEKSIGAEEFELKFATLLKEFSTELEYDAQGEYQRAAARLAGSYAALISHRIRRIKETGSRHLFPEQASDHDMNLPQVSVLPVSAEESEVLDANYLQDDQDQIFTVLDLKAFIAPSKSLCNLRHKLSRFVQPDVIQAITTELLELGPSEMQDVTFRIQWDLLKYCKEELRGSHTLAPVLTISGNAKTPYATSCDDYMSFCWPNTGRQTLQTLEEAISCNIYSKLVAKSLEIEHYLTFI